MSMPRPKGRKKDRMKVTKLRVRDAETGDEREVTDPDEIVRLKADGFTVDEATGAIGLGPRLRPQ